MIFIKFRKFPSTSGMSIHNKYIHIHNKKRTEINIKITQVHHSDLEMLMFISICFMLFLFVGIEVSGAVEAVLPSISPEVTILLRLVCALL